MIYAFCLVLVYSKAIRCRNEWCHMGQCRQSGIWYCFECRSSYSSSSWDNSIYPRNIQNHIHITSIYQYVLLLFSGLLANISVLYATAYLSIDDKDVTMVWVSGHSWCSTFSSCVNFPGSGVMIAVILKLINATLLADKSAIALPDWARSR